MSVGIRTQHIDPQPLIDSVIGNRSGKTSQIQSSELAVQLMSTGPLAEQLDTLESQITSGAVAVSSWARLQEVAPSLDGAGGEVLDVDRGEHQKATATGYNGTFEPNAGRYSWNATWGLWERIGATGLSLTATQAQLAAVQSELLEDIQAVAGGLTIEGAWNASGSFPADARRGDFYVVSDGGTVDGQLFNVGDWLVAVSDTASTTSFAGSWIRAAYGAPSVTQYDTLGEFIAADLSALPANRIIQVAGACWVKVPGATAFAKPDWEPIEFGTVDQLKTSLRALEVGDEIRAQGFLYNVEPAVFAAPHILTPSGARLSVKGENVDILAFGADPTGVRECSAEWNTATQWCVARGVKGNSHGAFYCLNSIAPGGLLRWDFGSQTLLQWKGINTADLQEIQHQPNGATEATGSGFFVLFDTSGMQDSTLDGQMVISGSLVGKMDLATRKNIRSNVVGLSAVSSSSPEVRLDKLHIRGCGIAIYGADWSGSDAAVLGKTRWTINDLEISFNLAWIRTSASGNNLDEMKVHNVHLTRNGGLKSIIRGTEFSADHVLIKGLEDVKDLEPGTVALTAGTYIANLSIDNPDLSAGMTICIEGGSSSPDGTPIWLVADIVAKAGTQLTLDRNAQNTVAAGGYVADPMDTELFAAGWDVKRTYFENLLGYGLLIRNSSWMLGRVKASKGVLGCLYDCPIIARPDVGTSCTIDIVAEGTNQNNADMKALVGVAPLRQGNAYNSVSAKVKAVGRKADFTTHGALLRVIETVGAPVSAANLNSSHDEHHEDLTLLAEYDDVSEYYQQIGGTKVAFKFGKHGAAEYFDRLAIENGTAQNGFSSTAGGSSNKANGTSGYIVYNVTENTRIRLSGTIPSGAAISPDARWYSGGTLVSVDRVLSRKTGRFVVHLDVPAGVNRLRIFANTTDVFTLEELTVETQRAA